MTIKTLEKKLKKALTMYEDGEVVECADLLRKLANDIEEDGVKCFCKYEFK